MIECDLVHSREKEKPRSGQDSVALALFDAKERMPYQQNGQNGKQPW